MFGPPKIERSPDPPPGVFIIDDGSGEFLGGGVDGGCILAREVLTAGDGEVARYKSKSAPSSPDLPVFSFCIRFMLARFRIGGGVLGGEERILKECVGNKSPSSSEGAS